VNLDADVDAFGSLTIATTDAADDNITIAETADLEAGDDITINTPAGDGPITLDGAAGESSITSDLGNVDINGVVTSSVANRDLAITADDGDVTIDSLAMDGAGDDLTVTAENITLENDIASTLAGDLDLDGSINVTLADGADDADLTVGGTIDIDSLDTVDIDGNTEAAGEITIDSVNDTVTDGTIDSTGDAVTIVSSQGSVDINADIEAEDNVTLTADEDDISIGADVTSDDESIIATAAGNLEVIGAGTVLAADENVDLEATTGTVTTDAGSDILAENSVEIDAGNTINLGGTIGEDTAIGNDVEIGLDLLTDGDVTVTGNITADDDTTVASGAGINIHSVAVDPAADPVVLISGEDIELVAVNGNIDVGNADIDAGTILANGEGDVVAVASGEINLTSTTIDSPVRVTLVADGELGPNNIDRGDISDALADDVGDFATGIATITGDGVGSIVMSDDSVVTAADIKAQGAAVTVGVLTENADDLGEIWVNATHGSIEASNVDADVELNADDITLNAITGIGENDPIDIDSSANTDGADGSAVLVTAATTGDDADIALDGVNGGAADDHLTLRDIDTQSGDVNVTADGTINVTSVEVRDGGLQNGLTDDTQSVVISTIDGAAGDINVTTITSDFDTDLTTGGDGDVNLLETVELGPGGVPKPAIESMNDVSITVTDGSVYDEDSDNTSVMAGGEISLSVSNRIGVDETLAVTTTNPLNIDAEGDVNLTYTGGVLPAGSAYWAVLAGNAGGDADPDQINFDAGASTTTAAPANLWWNVGLIGGQQTALLDYVRYQGFVQEVYHLNSGQAVFAPSYSAFFLHVASQMTEFWPVPVIEFINQGGGKIYGLPQGLAIPRNIDVLHTFDEPFTWEFDPSEDKKKDSSSAR
jgi:hypothetical protein